MRKSAHKDILKFLQKVIPGGSQGQLSRRICLMACLIQACVSNGHSRLESLSEAMEAYKAQKKSSLLQQAKRWLSNKCVALCFWVMENLTGRPFASGAVTASGCLLSEHLVIAKLISMVRLPASILFKLPVAFALSPMPCQRVSSFVASVLSVG